MYNYFSNIDGSYRMHSNMVIKYRYCESVLCVYTDVLFLYLLFDSSKRGKVPIKTAADVKFF
jgi:hypothetical protein